MDEFAPLYVSDLTFVDDRWSQFESKTILGGALRDKRRDAAEGMICLLDYQRGENRLRINAVRHQVEHRQYEKSNDSSKEHSEMSRICQTEFQDRSCSPLCWLRTRTIAQNAPYVYNGEGYVEFLLRRGDDESRTSFRL